MDVLKMLMVAKFPVLIGDNKPQLARRVIKKLPSSILVDYNTVEVTCFFFYTWNKEKRKAIIEFYWKDAQWQWCDFHLVEYDEPSQSDAFIFVDDIDGYEAEQKPSEAQRFSELWIENLIRSK